MFFLKRSHFNKTNIIKGLCIALLFACPLYLYHFDINSKLTNSALVLLSFYFIIASSRVTLFYTGFFTGIFWFYWISLSFRFYDLTYLIPLAILFFGLVYGFLFLLTTIKDNKILRATLFFGLTFLNPVGFDWFKPEVLFVNTFFEANKVILALVLFFSVLLYYKKTISAIAILCSLFFININPKTENLPNLKVYMPTFNIGKEEKWDKKNLSRILDDNFTQIDKAILKGYDLIVFPETSFPLVLNKSDFILSALIEKSHAISIVAGSLYFEKGDYKNSTYIFKNGKLEVAHKVVLVPFGEAIPLPKIISDFINNTFYGGAKDFVKAPKPTDYKIKNISFRNAICYEATSEEIYKDLGQTKNMIVISNNAWFTPSIEPTLQKMLLKMYSSKYGINIYHQVNKSPNYIISN